MDKDLNNLKKWFKDLGHDVDGQVNDDILKKLMPPQRRDMWRNIMKHVKPKEQVDLIKKAILLHKLQKHQTPLMAQVESLEDLANAIKYEELMTKFNKIQKEIAETKLSNNKIKLDLKNKNEYKKNILKNIELKQNKLYLVKQKSESYNKRIDEVSELSNICKDLSTDVNELLTKTDYEDSLIKCLKEVDDAKQSGIMNDSVNVGKTLCNAIYSTICDKSPVILIQTIEENISNHTNNCNEMIRMGNETTGNINEHENVLDELLAKLYKIQLEFSLKLDNTLIEKERLKRTLNEIILCVKNEVLEKYKLKNSSYTDSEFLAFKENLKIAVENVIKTSIECCETIGLEENDNFKDHMYQMLNNNSEKTDALNLEIDQKKIYVCDMMKEINNKKIDIEFMEVTTIIEKLADYYSKNINDHINKSIISIKDIVCRDVDNIDQLTILSFPKSIFVNYQMLQDIKKCSETIDVIFETKMKFEQSNIIKSELNSATQNSLYEIIEKENFHKLEFNNIITEMENNILKLHSNIEDCKLADDIISTKRFDNILPGK